MSQATTLVLEALFDVKAAVSDIHELIFSIGEDDDDEEEVDGDDS